MRTLVLACKAVESITEQMIKFTRGVLAELSWLAENAPHVYGEFEQVHKERLGLLVNHVQSLSALLRTEVSSG